MGKEAIGASGDEFFGPGENRKVGAKIKVTREPENEADDREDKGKNNKRQVGALD